jgi:uncharacterized protein YfbU (UPF0304 family)
MHLTKLERLLLIQQSTILAKLQPETAERHAALVELLTGGFKLYYADALGGLRDDLPEEECLLVLRVLHMYGALDAHVRDNPVDAAVAQHPWARFRGFDAATEPQHHAFAIYVMRRLGKFPEQWARAAEAGGFDAGVPTLLHVRPMAAAWQAMGEPVPLTHEQAAAVLIASGA